MRLFPLAVAAGLLPILTIHLCYGIAVYYQHLPLCFPYIDSCISISASGRQAPEFFLFKGLMIPSALFIALFWLGNFLWLRELHRDKIKTLTAMVLFACIACLGLVLYSVMLGAIGDVYRNYRRIGVIIVFSMTFISQVIAIILLKSSAAFQNNEISRPGWYGLVAIVLLIFAFAIAAVVISAWNENVYDSIEDAFEWTVTLLLNLQPLIVARLWQQTNFRIEPKTSWA